MLGRESLTENRDANNAMAGVPGDVYQCSDDFGQRPAGGWSYSPPPQGGGGAGPPGHKPAGGWSYDPPGGGDGGDIWGEPGTGEPAGIGEIFSNFFMLLKRSFGGILVVFVLMATIQFCFECPQWTVSFLATGLVDVGADTMTTIASVSICSMLLIYFAYVLVIALMIAMVRPMRIALVQGTEDLEGVGGTLREAFSKFIPALVVAIIMLFVVSIGSIFCIIPGFIGMVYMYFVGHLICATDCAFGEAFGEAFRLLKENIVAVIVAVVVLFLLTAFIGGCPAGIAAGAVAITPEYGGIITMVVAYCIKIVVFIVMSIFIGAFTTTIETCDAGVELYYD